MNRYPAKPMMDQMAQHGRYGDTMLVHMNPVEVAGLASLSPNGKLTTNPVTGQPEAFLPLLFGGLGSLLKLSPLMTGVLSGVGTAAVTGDLKRGLLAGVTSGLTAGAGDLIEAGSSAATAAEGIATVDPTLISDGAVALDATQAATEGLTATADAANILGETAAQNVSDLSTSTGGLADMYAPVNTSLPVGAPDVVTNPGILDQARAGVPDFLKQQPAFMDTAIDKLGVSGNLVGAMTAEGMSQQMQTQQDFERQQMARREESEAKRRQAYDDLQGAYAMAQPGAQRGYSPYRSMMSRNAPPPFVPGMNTGGVTGYITFPEWLAGPGAGYANSPDDEKYQAYYEFLQGQQAGDGTTDDTGTTDTGTTDTGTTDTGAGTAPAPISTVPSEEEVRVLNIAGRGDILGRSDQQVLEQYYNRLSLANQEANEADAAATAEDNTLYIPEGATNAEALQALRQANLVPTDAFNWLMRHYQETETGDNQYFASENFPGTEEYLAGSGFNEENKNYLRTILPLIQQGATTGIPLTGGEGSVEGIVAYNPFTQYYGGGANAGYGGLDPVTIQKNLRGGVSVAPPRDYMPGFEPEFSYFQEDPNRLDIPNRAYRPTARRFFNYGEGYFDPVMEEEAYLDQLSEYYTKLGGYGPKSVTYPTETEPTPDDPDNVGDGGGTTQEPTGDGSAVSREVVDGLYQELFGRNARDPGYEYWADQVARGLVSADRLKDALISSAMTHPDDHPDKIKLMAYLASLDGGATDGGGATDDGSTTTDGGGTTTGPTLSRSDLDALYQELFGRDAKDAGAEYWMSQVQSGAVPPDRLREVLISAASGADLDWYRKNVLGEGTGTTTDDGSTTTDDGSTGSQPLQPAPTPDEDGYYSAADARGVDDFLWSNRTSFYGVRVKADSKADVSSEDFNSALATEKGRYGGRMIYNPETGYIYEGITDDMSQSEKDAFLNNIEEYRNAGTGHSIPSGIDPSLLTQTEIVRLKMTGANPQGGKTRRIGNTKYFTDKNGKITSYQVKDLEYGGTRPSFGPGMKDGGTVPLRTSMGDTEVSAGGIANVPTEFTASMPSEQEFSMIAAAVLGRLDNADAIVDMFVEKYGPEMFQRVREFVLQNVAPNAQTEGMIRGNGSGMDDKVPGMIGDQQPVAVSPGEFIVPADVVSGLGDGSSDAGADELAKMMDRVRMARGGTTKQAPSIDTGKMMPA